MAHRFPALIAAPAPARGRLWLTGARLFDGSPAAGHAGALREDTAVLIEDGVIRRVADDRERCPDGARPLDLVLPELTGPEVMRRMHATLPDVRVLVYSGTFNKSLIMEALKCKPDGYIEKSDSLARRPCNASTSITIQSLVSAWKIGTP